MKYLFLLLPLSLLLLSLHYNMKYKSMIGTGKIPDIIAARRNVTLFVVLALAITCAFFLFLSYSA